MKALILAAGLGSRLAPLTDAVPKSLVEVNGEPIVFRQIRNLLSVGIDDITLVSGYLANVMSSRVGDEFPDVHIIENADYAITNNMYSAFMGLEAVGEVDDGLLMMNADVFYDVSVLRALLSFPFPDAIVVDMGRYMEESMKVTLADSGRVTAISKQISEMEAAGCSIDVYRFSSSGVAAFRRACEEHIEGAGELTLWSEVALSDILKHVDFRACPLDGRWFEIDNHEDLAAAKKLFL